MYLIIQLTLKVKLSVLSSVTDKFLNSVWSAGLDALWCQCQFNPETVVLNEDFENNVFNVSKLLFAYLLYYQQNSSFIYFCCYNILFWRSYLSYRYSWIIQKEIFFWSRSVYIIETEKHQDTRVITRLPSPQNYSSLLYRINKICPKLSIGSHLFIRLYRKSEVHYC